MNADLARRLIVPAAIGAGLAVLVMVVLVADLSLQHDGAVPASVAWGLLVAGPWVLLFTLPVCVGGGLAAGALAPHVGLPPRLALAVLFTAFAGIPTALAVTVMVPFLWLPAGVTAIALVGVAGVASAAAAFSVARVPTD